jgi:hypothetical protein
LDGIAPVLAVKVPADAPEATVTDAGTVRPTAELDSGTGVEAVAAFESVTVHNALVFEVKLVGLHWSEDTTAAETRDTEVFAEDPFRVAVIVAV